MDDLHNELLRKLGSGELELIRPLLTPVALATRHIVLEAEAPVTHVYFPETATISIMATVPEGGAMIEVGMVGREGMTDSATCAGGVSPFRFIVQVPGTAWCMTRENFAKAHAEFPRLADLTSRFRESLSVQFGFSALSHGTDTIETRLARWLLMSFDRTRTRDIPLVHEFIAAMLAVRRSGVTTALHTLEGVQAIQARRGRIELRSRAKLRAIAGRSYGLAEAHHERLFGDLPGQSSSS